MLTVWTGFVALVLLRPGRLAEAVGGPWDERLAVATVVAALVASWLWSWRDVARSAVARPGGSSQWALAREAFARNPTAVAGVVVLVALYLLALVAPLIAPFHPNAQPPDIAPLRLLPPSSTHLAGTDHLGRDIFSRLLYGARISLTIGFVAVGISVTVGTLVGATAGFLGGVVDGVLMRFVDMIISFPRLVLLIAIVGIFPSSIFVIVVVLGLTMWPSTARLVRGEVLALREREFVEAAAALGYSRARILLHHLVPNTIAPIVVAATLGIGHTIVLEAGLSFLGIGVRPPTASWGSMIDQGSQHMLQAWWHSTFAGLAIVVTVLSFNLVGDGLRDALDPRLRR